MVGVTPCAGPPNRNAEFWAAKVAGNVERGETERVALAELGWTLVTVWEHDDATDSVERVSAAVRR